MHITFDTDLERGVSISVLPKEVLSRILAYTMESKIPLHLQEFTNAGKRHQEQTNGLIQKYSKARSYSRFTSMLHPSQKEHYLDWLLVTATSHKNRYYGKIHFFAKKTFIISPALLEAIQDGRCRNISASTKVLLGYRTRDVIAPLRRFELRDEIKDFGCYNELKGLRELHLQPRMTCNTSMMHLAHAHPELDSAPIRKVQGPLITDKATLLLQDRPVRYPLSPEVQGMLKLLAGLDSRAGRITLDLMCPDYAFFLTRKDRRRAKYRSYFEGLDFEDLDHENLDFFKDSKKLVKDSDVKKPDLLTNSDFEKLDLEDPAPSHSPRPIRHIPYHGRGPRKIRFIGQHVANRMLQGVA